MRRKAFTLVELLVVIGIIAVLISILMPSLSRTRQMAVRTNCLSNLRQLTMANQGYLNDNKQTLPFCNWGSGFDWKNAKIGWLFEAPLSGSDPAQVETGSFWPYLKSRGIFRCPTHVKAESAAFGSSQTDGLTSYLMNGAVNGYGEGDGSGPAGQHIKFYKINKFKPDDILLWEADERGGAAWNDGSSFPGESFNPKDPGAAGLTVRHGKVACLALMDGSAEWVNHEDFYRLAADSKRNRLWCDPGSENGH